MLDGHARTRWSDASPDIRNSIDVHQAIRTMARAAQQTARPVIFEAASENALACAIKRGRHGIAFLDGNRFSVEADVHYDSGRQVASTVLVRVSRRAWNHL